MMSKKRKLDRMNLTTQSDNCHVFSRLQYFRSNNIMCDVTIKIKDKSFPSHKVILSAVSEFFLKLFTVDLSEKNEKIIELTGVSAVAFKIALDFIYGADIDFVQFADDCIGEILNAACYFQINELKEKCLNVMEIALSLKNCFIYFNLSILFGCRNLQKQCIQYINKNAEILFHSKGSQNYLEMSKTAFKTLLSLDELIIEEQQLYDCLLNWIFYAEQRKQKFCELFQYIRIPTMERKAITSTVMNNQLVRDCKSCQSYVTASLAFNEIAKSSTLKEFQTQHRDTDKVLLHCNKSNEIWFLKFQGNDFISSKNLTKFPYCKDKRNPLLNSYIFSLAIHNRDIYVLDINGSQNSSCYKFLTTKWIELPPNHYQHNSNFINHSFTIFNSYTRKCVSITYKNKLFLLGGCDQNRIIIQNCEYFDIEKQKWIKLPTMNFARCDFASAALNHSIYAIGGWDSRPLQSVEKFNFKSMCWTLVPNLLHKRRSCAAANYEDKLFVVGGLSTNCVRSTAEVYCEKTNKWTEIASLNCKREGCGAIVVNGRLFILGGMDNRNVKASLYEIWDHKKNKFVTFEADNQEHIIGRCDVINI